MSLWRRVYREQRAVTLPVVVLLAINLGVLALGVAPLKQHVSSLEGERSDAQHNLQLARLAEQRAKNEVASKQLALQQLRQFYSAILPTDYASASKLVGDFLQARARETGLVIQRSQAELDDVKDSRLKRVVGKVTLRGDYSNIRKFLYAVETAEEFVIVDRIALNQASDMRSSASGVLEITLDVTTFYLPPGAQ
jgi:Tfp pilus assembly protein PilO